MLKVVTEEPLPRWGMEQSGVPVRSGYISVSSFHFTAENIRRIKQFYTQHAGELPGMVSLWDRKLRYKTSNPNVTLPILSGAIDVYVTGNFQRVQDLTQHCATLILSNLATTHVNIRRMTKALQRG